MNILITGGAGFIGSHLTDSLIELKNNVTIADNLRTGKKENVNPKAKFYEIDVNDKKLENVFKEGEFNVVSHHAANVNVRVSLEDPFFDATNNILTGINTLEFCRKFDVKKIIYSSSVAVYGDPENIFCGEDDKLNPLSPYGISKQVVEKYIELYSKLYGIDYTILRYSNVYGPRQNPKGEMGVVSIFIQNMLNNKQPVIFGDGKQTRDFIYVKDVVEANVLALNKKGIFNIGTGIQTSVNQVYDILKDLTKYKGNVIHEKEIEGEVKHVCLNNSKASSILGWKPKVNIEEGLRKTINY